MSAVDVEQLQPISRTYQYRKVMKPLLERKRRARINHCLDELKEFILSSLQAEGENVSKLEKADILEFTVRHLRRLKQKSSPPATQYRDPDADCFRAGFSNCASEVSRFLALTSGVNMNFGTKLMTHLGHRLNDMAKTTPLSVRVVDNYSPAPSSPSSISSYESSYPMPLTPNSMVSSTTTVYSRNPSPCRTDTSWNLGQPSVMDAPSTPPSPPSPPSSLSSSPVDLETTSIKFDSSSPMWRPW